MRTIGLTGGIGSGKSTVAELLADRGAAVIDADRLAREVLEPGTDGLQEVAERFGDRVLREDGRLDREALAAVVFSDDSARQALNAIVHPRVGREIAARLQELRDQEAADGRERTVVLDVPLLVESASTRDYDAVVVVTAPEGVRLERLEDRGMDPEDARARIASQASDEERLEQATHVIDNSGDLDELRQQVNELWRDLTGDPA